MRFSFTLSLLLYESGWQIVQQMIIRKRPFTSFAVAKDNSSYMGDSFLEQRHN